MHPIFVNPDEPSVPILFVTAATFDKATEIIDDRERTFLRASGYEPKPGRYLAVPGPDGKLAGVLFGLETPDAPVQDPFRPGQLVTLLPPGTYRFANAPHDARLAALAFALGAYQFTRYRKAEAREVRLVLPDGVDGEDLTRIAEGVALARDLINTPSNDMGPAELEDAARALAKQHGAKAEVTAGKALAKGFPLVHAVGAGSVREPRLIDITWGDAGRSEDHAGRQGRVFRHRRPRHQERRRHAQHEEGHGRRRHRFGVGAHDHGAQAQGAAARHHPGGGEFDLGHELPAARYLHVAQGHQRRDRQYRRGRAAHSCRLAGACR